ncbi:hypothetical protein Misp01_40080 [Microtetraspora sp. NBRC 13810]|uniref:DUF5667 domain-containing protein n=1 Tax=Microtetraspora sp. NBRC 13810 TaxID=3030990 RepID=UPI0025563043|nr:DUF5667 domain-containing protein [Microtetraspora sp. NBRC 13810]GLW08878.1 hypothetical protein Misp01_40080 [Microtetraspora sp. NBRC 13810]
MLRRHAAARRAHARLTGQLSDLGSRMSGGPRPEFRARLRGDLLSVYAEEREEPGQPGADRPAASRRHPRLRIFPQVLAFAMALVMMVTALVAYRSVPGDTLYPLKRGAESALVRLSPDAEDQARRELAAAHERAVEVAELLGPRAHEPSRELVDETLADMEQTTRSAVTKLRRAKRKDPQSRSRLRRFAEEQHNMVAPMVPKMDEESRRKAKGYLNYIDGFVAPD